MTNFPPEWIVSALIAPLFALNSSPSVDPEMCDGQPNNHLIPNPLDCKSFFICRDNEAVAETCSASFWFDPYRLVCALPDKSYCTELACLGYSNTFAADPTCGVYHYCAAESVTFSGTCNDDLTFDAISQTCTYPHCWEYDVKDEGFGSGDEAVTEEVDGIRPRDVSEAEPYDDQ